MTPVPNFAACWMQKDNNVFLLNQTEQTILIETFDWDNQNYMALTKYDCSLFLAFKTKGKS